MAARELSVWGWGYADTPEPPQVDSALQSYRFLLGKPNYTLFPPDVAAIARGLRKPRFNLADAPAEVRQICSDDPKTRMRLSYGRSTRDIFRAILGGFSNPPDYVALPRTESDIVALLAWADRTATHVIPVGGGTTVAAGTEPLKGATRVVAVDMTKHFNKVLEANTTDMTALVQGGVTGPGLNTQLRKWGLTLRHFPQAWELATVGGWLATRSGGHYATNLTHIDSFVVSLRIITPRGIIDTLPVPSSGAGPTPDRVFLGSEGILGIVTQCRLRVQHPPQHRVATTLVFPSFAKGSEATRAIVQASLYPAQCRLVDGAESRAYGIGGDVRLDQACLLLGFESAHVGDLETRCMAPAIALARKFGGLVVAPGGTDTESPAADESATFRSSFITVPYLRDALLLRGFWLETFETACSWSRWEELKTGVEAVARERKAVVTTRYTHVYTDGPAMYFTVAFRPSSPNAAISEWNRMKTAFTTCVLDHGGTLTHHHAVGKDLAVFYEREKGAVWTDTVRAIKRHFDPNGIMNPGTVVPVQQSGEGTKSKI
ncbi:alkylglycerone-phosphate synthase [Gonapodya prolifera JEL478]|uniref:Alkylglycerone-phosphate synthase n=1 Tax=Gonapodya prolifera (strain JEL478) TaxID=1344416 RepID=A0A139A4C6_GONPJ|nr:alkylglycerone-phosphate synthase [Gonapodya prolifera JEL478]|eukprot:KXS11529.1 alkylglycerone-phosphate synthase [Gonapodya prolifera JEL478]